MSLFYDESCVKVLFDIKFVDHNGQSLALGVLHEVRDQGRLPRSEEPGDHGHRQTLSHDD